MTGGGGAPLRFRILHRADGLVPVWRKQADKPAATRLIATDVAAEVVTLLESGIVLTDPAAADPPGRALAPGDMAVLVRTNAQASLTEAALAAAGVPAVLAGAGSVFTSPGAAAWLHLLEALCRPSDSGLVRRVALTDFLGWSATALAEVDQDRLADLHGQVHRWAETLRRRGVAALLAQLTAETGLPARILAHHDGERRLTDLRHVAELLHAEAVAEQLGPAALTRWLRRQLAEADETGSEAHTRRLESDADAVQVLTVHRSKGLEFPVVLCPYLWDGAKVPEKFPVVPDERTGYGSVIDLSSPTSQDAADSKERADRERLGEDLRMAYVALTRARHRAVVWWVGATTSGEGPLTRLLTCRAGDRRQLVGSGNRPPDDAVLLARLDELMAAAPGCVAVEHIARRDPARWAPGPAATPVLRRRHLSRTLDRAWRRTSYTALTTSAHSAYEERVASEPEYGGIADEATAPTTEPATPAPDGEWSAEVRLSGLAGGRHVGTIVHAVLEACDFASSRLEEDLRAALDGEATPAGVEVDTAGAAAGLTTALTTPLGPGVADVRLVDIGRRDRLDELAFELPLGGGDRPVAAATLEALADLLDGSIPAGDPLAGYGRHLRDRPPVDPLRGYLTGSIDVVLRLPGPSFVVVDYKTNRLAPEGEPLIPWHYRPEALVTAMVAADYPLQALLYSVALHRYLRWRLPGYRPEEHLGGILYLFLRGMTGPDTPRSAAGQPSGVFFWTPPEGLVPAISDLLDRGPG